MSTSARSTEAPTIVLGLLSDPGLPSKLSEELAGQLPELLYRETGGRAKWVVQTATEALTLDENGTLPSVEIGRRRMAEEGWDLIILITDLPRRAEGRPIISDYGLSSGVALVSLPGLGAVGLRRQARKVITHLIVEHLINKPLGDVDANGQRHGRQRDHLPLGIKAAAEHIDSEDEGIDMHLVLKGNAGRLRLLAGMVRTNRPWRLVPSLSPAIAGAAAGAAFGVFYSNIWHLADALSGSRLALINVLAVLAMVVWLIVDNNLWERPTDRQLREEAVLYNAATAVTIGLGVLCMYVLLFAVTLFSALIVISPGLLESTLQHPSGFAEYMRVVWLAASMGTIAGALGSGFAGEDAVRQAAYSKREQQRRARFPSSEGG
jgi:hypothetical protein